VAYQLARHHHRSAIFEGDDSVGGMAAAFDFGGVSVERYWHFHCTCDRSFLQLLDGLGLAGKMRWGVTKMAYWHRGRLQAWGNPLALENLKAWG